MQNLAITGSFAAAAARNTGAQRGSLDLILQIFLDARKQKDLRRIRKKAPSHTDSFGNVTASVRHQTPTIPSASF